MSVILVLTVTLLVPGSGAHTDTIELPMHSMPECRKAGQEYAGRSALLHRIEFVCRPAP